MILCLRQFLIRHHLLIILSNNCLVRLSLRNLFSPVTCFSSSVTELIPLLASSPSISLDQPILRTSGQTMVLKTNHICQWLEVAASYHTEVIVQSLLEGKSECTVSIRYLLPREPSISPQPTSMQVDKVGRACIICFC